MNRLILLLKTSQENFLQDLGTAIAKHPHYRVILDNNLVKFLANECFNNAILSHDFDNNIIALFKDKPIESLTLKSVDGPAKEVEVIKLKTKEHEWKSFPAWSKLTLTASKRKVDTHNRQVEVEMGK